MSSAKWRPFCPGKDELNAAYMCHSASMSYCQTVDKADYLYQWGHYKHNTDCITMVAWMHLPPAWAIWYSILNSSHLDKMAAIS